MSIVTARWSEQARRSYAQLIDTLTADGAHESARRLTEIAISEGMWRHPLQRPSHYLASLPPRPVYDPADFWFCSYLEENYRQIRAELDAQVDPAVSGFLPVDEPLVSAGRWDQVVFYESGYRFEDACARFPVTASLIDGIPEAAAAGIGVVTLSWLAPGTRIVPHCGSTNARLRVHLGLRTPPGARLRVGDEVLSWEEGRCLVFDDSFEHEVWHDGESPRVVLIMDVSHPDLEPVIRDRMLASRSSFEARIIRFLKDRGMRRVELDHDDVRVLLDERNGAQMIRYMRERGSRAAELRGGKLVFEPMGETDD
ncbi:aspartyl/asparaginyl beta-hydroxylase domain-containing protein [Kribbella sp. NBC_01505]|uniref:aspartyl/asparaginyl beta-hydroxylase domain-containing protein n=1 Tax=Kribbella sp. NBC_01505 TaxID=2903580 RepID=UPI00386613F9